jgi:hypothetical protein|tara:strand:- start:303 stop:683 length:381 start_codon:yes stop_codon:yes gene_type:complete
MLTNGINQGGKGMPKRNTNQYTMKRTKGKWEAQCQVDDPTVYNDERCEGEEFDVYAVCETVDYCGLKRVKEVLIVDHISGGDANLIASAPDLLSAIKPLVKRIKADYHPPHIIKFAEEAIAKAEGK